MEPDSVLITGASSGIGESLALAYARHGIDIAVTGRDAGRLAEVTSRLEARGARVDARALDVSDADAMAAWVSEVDARAPLDLVIANAGVSGGPGGPGHLAEKARLIFATNLDGVLNTLHPVIPRMCARGRGQIAIVSSLAGFRGLPGAPAYSASKAAVKVYGEGLRGYLKRRGVAVSVICPGFVRSRMTASNRFPMPFLMDADEAARRIRVGLARNRGRIAFPLPMYLAVWGLSGLPNFLLDQLTTRLPRKN